MLFIPFRLGQLQTIFLFFFFFKNPLLPFSVSPSSKHVCVPLSLSHIFFLFNRSTVFNRKAWILLSQRKGFSKDIFMFKSMQGGQCLMWSKNTGWWYLGVKGSLLKRFKTERVYSAGLPMATLTRHKASSNFRAAWFSLKKIRKLF